MRFKISGTELGSIVHYVLNNHQMLLGGAAAGMQPDGTSLTGASPIPNMNNPMQGNNQLNPPLPNIPNKN